MSGWRAALTAAAALLCAGCLTARPSGANLSPDPVLACYDWGQPARQWRLPRALRELSGMVHLDGDRWLGHDDNHAGIWLLDLAGDGHFAPLPVATEAEVPRADFEAMTRQGQALYLLASPGRLYATRLQGKPGAARPVLAEAPQPLGIDIAGTCNFEGLAAVADGGLWLACKYPRAPVPGHVLLYQLPWLDPDAAARRLAVDVTPVLAAIGRDRLRPSDLAWIPGLGRLLVLAGKEHVLLELNGDGTLLAWRALSRRHHRQAEALAVAADGRLLIGDEADGRTATAGLYPRHRSGPAKQAPRHCERL